MRLRYEAESKRLGEAEKGLKKERGGEKLDRLLTYVPRVGPPSFETAAALTITGITLRKNYET